MTSEIPRGAPIRAHRLLAMLLTCMVSSTVQAADSIHLAEALRRTLADNRSLAAYPLQKNRAEALQLQAGLRPLPRVDLTVENALGNGSYDSFDASETTLALSQVIELGDKRNFREALAASTVRELEAEYELARLDVLAETSRRYYTVLALQARQALNGDLVAALRKTLEIVRERATAGAVPRADVLRIELRLAQALSEGQQLRNEQALGHTRLAAMWQAAPEFERVRGDIAQVPSLPSQTQLTQALDGAPQLLHQLALQRLADARVSLAQAQGRSDLSVGIGVRHFEASDDQALVLSVGMPLGFENPNRGRIAAARAQRALSEQNAALARRELELGLAEIQLRMSAQRDRLGAIKSQLLPLSQELLAATLQGYQRGQYSGLRLIDAQQETFELQSQMIELQIALHLQLLELERITGAALTASAAGDPS